MYIAPSSQYIFTYFLCTAEESTTDKSLAPFPDVAYWREQRLEFSRFVVPYQSSIQQTDRGSFAKQRAQVILPRTQITPSGPRVTHFGSFPP